MVSTVKARTAPRARCAAPAARPKPIRTRQKILRPSPIQYPPPTGINPGLCVPNEHSGRSAPEPRKHSAAAARGSGAGNLRAAPASSPSHPPADALAWQIDQRDAAAAITAPPASARTQCAAAAALSAGSSGGSAESIPTGTSPPARQRQHPERRPHRRGEEQADHQQRHCASADALSARRRCFNASSDPTTPRRTSLRTSFQCSEVLLVCHLNIYRNREP